MPEERARVHRPRGRVHDLADVVLFSVATLGTYAAQELDRPITAVLVYLTGVIVLGARSGLSRGIVAALSASIIYNFFLSEPVFRFGVSTLDEAVPLIAFNLSAILTGALAGRLKDRAAAARNAEARNAYLLKLSDNLQRAITVADVQEIARSSLPAFPSIDLTLWTSGASEGSERGRSPPALKIQDFASGSDTFMRLHQLTGTRGDIGIVKYSSNAPQRELERLPDFQAVSNLLALTIERCLLLDELSEARAKQRSEELKDAILSSVSHDLRSPLTAIEAAATSLLSYGSDLSSTQREEMLRTITGQCERLNRFTSNLLDMGRIQAGISPDCFQEIDAAEILGVALANTKQRYPSCVIEKMIARGPLLVRANAAMLEQVFFNVLENAILHGSEANPVEVALSAEDAVISLCITDQGAGIVAGDQENVFERFFRGDHAKHRQGSGLGLYIAKGFLAAFGGSIEIKSPVHRSGMGTRVTIALPVAAATCQQVIV